MDYFVSIENIPYFHWQIDLLIESFKLHGIEDKLLVAVAHNEKKDTPPRYFDYADNLVPHKNMILHENYGRNNEFLPLNQIRSLAYAVEHELVKFPFALLHPDMIMVNPIEDQWTENVVFQDILTDREKVKNQFFEFVEPHVDNISKLIGQPREKLPEWMPIGDIVIFRDAPEGFFYRWINHIENFAGKYAFSELATINFPNNWKVNKLALALTMYEYFGQGMLTPATTHNLEQGMLEWKLRANFIHYNRGMPPVFSKFNYLKAGYEGCTAGDPSQILLENNPTPPTDYMNKVVRSFKKLD